VAPGPGAYPEKSRATIVLVLGILAVAAWGIFGPVAWWMGSRELAGIDAGSRPPHYRGLAKAGRILGIVGTVLTVGAVALFAMALTGIITVD
jgi:hypothetical protein